MNNERPGAIGAPASFAEIRQRIAKIPRVDIAIKNTPMIEMPNLARHLGGPRLFIKRDDLTGVALGGNKLPLNFREAEKCPNRWCW